MEAELFAELTEVCVRVCVCVRVRSSSFAVLCSPARREMSVPSLN